MGVVYKATQLNDGKDVALKVLHTHLSTDPEAIKRFQDEAKAASALMHPNIVRLYDFGMTQNGQPYIAMEFLEGTTLGQIIRQRKYFDTKDALPIIRQTCEALAEAHSHGVLHRDIKPANIMIMHRFGLENFVVVVDFSISKVIQTASEMETTTTGLVFGSPAYMSPERFMGKGGNFRADIYSMGIIMFQMLAGRPPFKSADIYALMNDHCSSAPPSVKDLRADSDIPESLEAIIAKALMKEPKERHANMKQLLAEINDVYTELSTLTKAVAPLNESLYSVDDEPIAAPLGAQLSLSNQGTPSSMKRTLTDSAPSIAPMRSDLPVFDIDPGVGAPKAVPQSKSAHLRKTQSLDESLNLRNSELNTSGRWDKSLIVKSAGSGGTHRPNIRPIESPARPPIELISLIAVMIIGLSVIFITLLTPKATEQSKIDEMIKGDNLSEALSAIDAWHPGKTLDESEAYAESCLAVAKAFIHKKDLDRAVSILDRVPAGTRASSEARMLSKQFHKPPQADNVDSKQKL